MVWILRKWIPFSWTYVQNNFWLFVSSDLIPWLFDLKITSSFTTPLPLHHSFTPIKYDLSIAFQYTEWGMWQTDREISQKWRKFVSEMYLVICAKLVVDNLVMFWCKSISFSQRRVKTIFTFLIAPGPQICSPSYLRHISNKFEVSMAGQFRVNRKHRKNRWTNIQMDGQRDRQGATLNVASQGGSHNKSVQGLWSHRGPKVAVLHWLEVSPYNTGCYAVMKHHPPSKKIKKW